MSDYTWREDEGAFGPQYHGFTCDPETRTMRQRIGSVVKGADGRWLALPTNARIESRWFAAVADAQQWLRKKWEGCAS